MDIEAIHALVKEQVRAEIAGGAILEMSQRLGKVESQVANVEKRIDLVHDHMTTRLEDLMTRTFGPETFTVTGVPERNGGIAGDVAAIKDSLGGDGLKVRLTKQVVGLVGGQAALLIGIVLWAARGFPGL